MITVREAFALAFTREAAGKPAEARAIYEQILAAIPDHPGALLKIAQAEHKEGRLDYALELLERAIDSAARENLPQVDIFMALGRLHKARAEFGAAQRAYERAHEVGMRAQEICRALASLALERVDLRCCLATALCQTGLIAHPGDAALLHLLCAALKECGELAKARSALTAAVMVPGSDPKILVSLAAVCIDLGQAREACEHLTLAIERGEDTAQTFDNLGLAYVQLGDMDEAARAFERSVAIDPKLTPALSNLLITLRKLCRWDRGDLPQKRQLLAGLDQSGHDRRRNPFLALALQTTPAQQLAIARSWSRHVLPPVQAPGLISARGARLRIGYLSSDFRDHPVARLITGYFERHDRRTFEVFGYSHGPADASAFRQRLRAGFEHWVEAQAMSDAQIARRIRDDRIDVLIDLNGHTQGNRLAILSRRPAPVQLHYMGFVGTLGFDGIDGFIADAVVVPPAGEVHFYERVLRLPRCYLVIDGASPLPPAASRAELGFGEKALVLVCFNQASKLTRRFFTLWMEVLAQMPDALLWLYAPLSIAQGNLRAEAVRAGIDPDRLRFAPRVPSHDEHIARLRCADLALDILPHGSHTTGCDALQADCADAVVPRDDASRSRGRSAQRRRVAGLATESIDAYRAELLTLARDCERLRDYKHHLERERRGLPLFDAAGFARDFETLLCGAYDELANAR